MTTSNSPLALSEDITGDVCLIEADGLLDSSTYLTLRDTIVKAALNEPRAVLVDVNKLDVPAPSAWAVFTSARWLVGTWPAVPIHLISGSVGQVATMARNGVTRYVRVHPTIEAALGALGDRQRARLRATTELPASLASLRMARQFVATRLAEWKFEELVPVTTVAVNVFVENVLQHTGDGPVLQLETDGTAVAVAVRDSSPTPPARREDPYRGGKQVSGLAVVASLSRAWGSSPTPSGKAVWAVVGPENRM